MVKTYFFTVFATTPLVKPAQSSKPMFSTLPLLMVCPAGRAGKSIKSSVIILVFTMLIFATF